MAFSLVESIDKPWIPARYVMVIMAFLGFFNLYALRVNLSVAIVAMVDERQDIRGQPVLSENLDTCTLSPNSSSTSLEREDKGGRFNWDSQLQGIILGSFFYGYILTQLAGAWVAKRFGPKLPFGLSALLSGITSFFIPLAAKRHVGALIALRVLQGFFQGVCYPTMHTMISLWAPPLERSKLVTIAYSGIHAGTVGALILSGIMADAWGWESVFYFFGATACLWSVFWYLLVFDSPASHPRISPAERAYITAAIGGPKAPPLTLPLPPPAVPWKQILTSLPVLAICVGHFGHNWGFYTLLTNLPTYFAKILHFNLKKNGVLSALPYVALVVLMPVCGYTADTLRRKGIFSTTSVRRGSHLLGQVIPAACLVAVGFIGCHVAGAVAVLVVAVGATALTQSGYQSNHIDLSPTYAGILMGISNTLSTIPGIVAPYVAGYITSGPTGQTISQWRVVFYISAGIYLVTSVFFAVFASGEPAKWDQDKARPLHGRLSTITEEVLSPIERRAIRKFHRKFHGNDGTP